MTHTPGPWRIGYPDGSGKDDYEDYFVITSVTTDEIVASGSSGESSDMKNWCVGIENKNDARLIASAPDLRQLCT